MDCRTSRRRGGNFFRKLCELGFVSHPVVVSWPRPGRFRRPTRLTATISWAVMWHIAARSIVAMMQGRAAEFLRCVAFSLDSTHRLAGGGSGSVFLWGLNGRIVREPVRVFADRHSKPVDDMICPPDAHLVATNLCECGRLGPVLSSMCCAATTRASWPLQRLLRTGNE